jgi:hypothetical protein
MARFYGYDIEGAIKTHLEDVTEGINAQITAINTSRSENAETIATIMPDFKNNTFPELYFELGESTIEDDGVLCGPRGDKDTELYELMVMISYKGADRNKIKLHGEIYIEALHKCLHKPNAAGITQVTYEASSRSDLWSRDNTNKYYRTVGAIFQVRIN